jgi:hypothetical protein
MQICQAIGIQGWGQGCPLRPCNTKCGSDVTRSDFVPAFIVKVGGQWGGGEWGKKMDRMCRMGRDDGQDRAKLEVTTAGARRPITSPWVPFFLVVKVNMAKVAMRRSASDNAIDKLRCCGPIKSWTSQNWNRVVSEVEPVSLPGRSS